MSTTVRQQADVGKFIRDTAQYLFLSSGSGPYELSTNFTMRAKSSCLISSGTVATKESKREDVHEKHRIMKDE